DAVDLGDALFDGRGRLDDAAHRVEVAGFAKGHHRGPARRTQRARTGTGERRAEVEAARPLRGLVVLEVAQVLVAVQHHRGALGRVAVLVRVGRHRRDAGNPEVERWHVVAEPFGPRQYEAAEARVGVEPDVARARELGEFADRVDHPVREARSR